MERREWVPTVHSRWHNLSPTVIVHRSWKIMCLDFYYQKINNQSNIILKTLLMSSSSICAFHQERQQCNSKNNDNKKPNNSSAIPQHNMTLWGTCLCKKWELCLVLLASISLDVPRSIKELLTNKISVTQTIEGHYPEHTFTHLEVILE